MISDRNFTNITERSVTSGFISAGSCAVMWLCQNTDGTKILEGFSLSLAVTFPLGLKSTLKTL